jgi:hypothetical protein
MLDVGSSAPEVKPKTPTVSPHVEECLEKLYYGNELADKDRPQAISFIFIAWNEYLQQNLQSFPSAPCGTCMLLHHRAVYGVSSSWQ